MLLPHARGRSTWPLASARLARHRFALALVAFTALLGNAIFAEAAPRRSKSQGRASARPKAASKATSRTTAGDAALADAKIAVLTFEGDDSEPLRKHVIKVLVERGLKVNSTLKPQDNPTQYRDMGAALDLAVYVHGKIKDTTPEHAVAIVTIRSAVSGRPVATATFNGFRRGLPFDVEEKLWERVGPAFKRACVEAARPGVRHHNAPMFIEAGTPL
jgi:hypothetical protein